MVSYLGTAQQYLLTFGCILKVSVSIPTKYSIDKVEPHARTYKERLATLEAFSQQGIPSSVNLKPLLPDIPEAEYEEIVTDIAPYVRDVLLGDEYIDPISPRQVLVKPTIQRRLVEWAHGSPIWVARIADAHRVAVYRRAQACGLRCWESDLSFMTHLIRRQRTRALAPANALQMAGGG
jgi:hypothetical protein